MNRFDENISKAPRLEISESLIDENFSVTLLTGFRKKKYFPEGHKINIKYFKAIYKANLFKVTLSLAILIWLLKNIKQNDILMVSPDSILIGLLVKKMKKCKTHLDIRTIPVEVNNTRRRINYFFFWAMPLKHFNRNFNSYSFITKPLKQNVEKEFNTKFKDYVLWHSGVNVDHFSKLLKNPKTPGNKFIITYLGVVTKSRGLDRVIQALPRLGDSYKENVIFQIIGDGPYIQKLKQLSSKMEILDKVIFKGYISYELVPKYLEDTDCFICPLPERPEWNISSPIKIFEYLACGRPVILTPIVAHKNIIINNDFVVWTEGDNINCFVKAIKYAFDNRCSLAESSKQAPVFIRNNYEWKIQGKKFAMYLERKYNLLN